MQSSKKNHARMTKRLLIFITVLFCLLACSNVDDDLDNAINMDDFLSAKKAIDNGAKINLLNKRGLSPLHRAAIENRPEILQYLVEKGADINILSSSGATPLDYAIEGGYIGLIKFLNSKNAKTQYSCLYCNHIIIENSVEAGKLDDVLFLKKKGANLFAKGDRDFTLLHIAAWHGKLKIVEYLVSEGLDVNAVDEWGETPLHKAAMKGNLEIVKYLVKKGANPHIKAIDGEARGMTPYDFAVIGKYNNVIEYLKYK